MAHFATLDESNIVTNVEVINNEVITDGDGVEQEELGIDFLTSLYGTGNYKQTSYNNNIRKNYAGIGHTYDATRDAFYAQQPYPSWTLNEDTCHWEAPVAHPFDAAGDDGSKYKWDEEVGDWVEVS